MKLLRFLFRRSKARLLVAVVAGFLSGAMTAALVAVINSALNPEASRFSGETLLWAFVGLFVAVPVSRLVSQYLLVNLGQGILHDLRLDLSRRLARTPLRRVEELRGHRLLATLTEDVTALGYSVVMLPALSVNLAVVLACLVYMGWLSWQLLLGAVAIMVVGAFTYRWPMRRGGEHYAAAREDHDALMGQFETLIDGNKEIKLHADRRDAFFQRMGGIVDRLRRRYVSGSLVFTMANSWGASLFFLILGLLLFGLPRLQTLDRATLTGYVLVLLYLRAPMQMLMNAMPQLSRGSIALAKIESLDLSLADEGDSSAVSRPPRPFDGLSLEGLTYTYDGEQREGEGFRIGPLDLEIAAGETVFIVGGNGSGKTTFAKVLTGLYPADSGTLRLGDQEIGEEERELYCSQFSVVFSDFFLFDELLGMAAERLDQEAGRYLDLLGLAHKVSVEDGRLSTTDLSAGQRKRLALLTAYLEDRPIYLFDEWAADQDPHFKRFFYRRLLPELKERGKTVLVISHDDAYFDAADRMLKLEYGQVVYDGPPAPFSGEVGAWRPAEMVGSPGGS